MPCNFSLIRSYRNQLRHKLHFPIQPSIDPISRNKQATFYTKLNPNPKRNNTQSRGNAAPVS